MTRDDPHSPTAALVQRLADKFHVNYAPTQTGEWARHVTRLVDSEVVLDDIEKALVALQRGGHLSRREMVRLQAQYLREIKL